MNELGLWLIDKWWRLPLIYVTGYVSFVTAITLVWSFVYRPCIQVISYGGDQVWSGEEIVEQALLQGLVWPIMGPLYTAFALIAGTIFSCVKGGQRLAKKASYSIPDGRHAGFQLPRGRQSDRY